MKPNGRGVMTAVTKEHEFKGSLKAVFAGISDYESYPDYIPGVINVEILEPLDEDAELSVRYELNLIKKFHYTLNMYHSGSNEISWVLHDSNLMKHNTGHWKLSAGNKKGHVHAEYSVDLKFKGLVPSAIIKKLTQTSLPAMFEGFQKLIDAQ